jgi:two-component system NtrC family response regulator
MTAYGSIKTAIDAMKAGAFDYVTKPVHPAELRALVDRAFAQESLVQATEGSVTPSGSGQQLGFEAMVGSSRETAAVIDLAARAARTDAPVLITGETGTGKEVLAKAIHFNSGRRDGPFVIVNCGAIPRDLVESELFGHVKGAFTGAVSHKNGKAEMADRGTLFLDEIGEMPLDMQVRVLRLIQHGEIQKVGMPNTTTVDVRVIAATHRNLVQLVESGGFREDLYYRLLVIPIEIPPLRKRREDIADLVRHLFKQSKEQYHREHLRLPEPLVSYFVQYDWPGNVRQLANCIVRVVVLAVGEEIKVTDLPEFLRQASPALLNPQKFSATMTLDAVERQVILEALEKFGWNQTRTAQHLGVTRKILSGRIAKYGIDKAKRASN